MSPTDAELARRLRESSGSPAAKGGSAERGPGAWAAGAKTSRLHVSSASVPAELPHPNLAEEGSNKEGKEDLNKAAPGPPSGMQEQESAGQVASAAHEADLVMDGALPEAREADASAAVRVHDNGAQLTISERAKRRAEERVKDRHGAATSPDRKVASESARDAARRDLDLSSDGGRLDAGASPTIAAASLQKANSSRAAREWRTPEADTGRWTSKGGAWETITEPATPISGPSKAAAMPAPAARQQEGGRPQVAHLPEEVKQGRAESLPVSPTGVWARYSATVVDSADHGPSSAPNAGQADRELASDGAPSSKERAVRDAKRSESGTSKASNKRKMEHSQLRPDKGAWPNA